VEHLAWLEVFKPRVLVLAGQFGEVVKTFSEREADAQASSTLRIGAGFSSFMKASVAPSEGAVKAGCRVD